VVQEVYYSNIWFWIKGKMVLRVTWFAFDKGPQRSVPDAVKKMCRNQETSGFVFLYTHTHENNVRGKEKKQKIYIDSGRENYFYG